MAVSSRKLEALRALAERPGTEAEGKLARALLDKLESRTKTDRGEGWLNQIPEESRASWDAFADFLRTGRHEDLERAIGFKFRVGYRTCDCGTEFPERLSCPNLDLHARIGEQRKVLFPRGMRVFYNCWAYPPNCPGNVTGYSQYWNWVRVKFDHLKNPRSVPAYKGRWQLFAEPIPYQTLKGMNIRGGMERFEREPQ